MANGWFSLTLHINGEAREFSSGLTVAALVAHLGMKGDRVAIELNLEIVPRTGWDAIVLKDGDKLEIVHFVGGGSGPDLMESSDPDLETEAVRPNFSTGPWTCPTCGETVDRKFCSNCGEKKPSKGDFSMRHFFTHALGEFFHFDSKIFRSFRLLFTRPGFLTAEYVRGCRKPYLHPFQLFFIANLIYFIMLPLIGWSGLRTTLRIQTHQMSYSQMASRLVAARTAAKGVTPEQFEHSFDHMVDVQARSLAVIMVPLYAMLVAVLQWRKRQYFGQHLVFSLHFAAFWLLALFTALYGACAWAFRIALHRGIRLDVLNSDNLIFPVALAILFTYAFFAMRTAYRDSVPMAIAKAVVLTFSLHYVLNAYRFILFFIALYFA
jgi:thiamine biosynthesis protein ThiS